MNWETKKAELIDMWTLPRSVMPASYKWHACDLESLPVWADHIFIRILLSKTWSSLWCEHCCSICLIILSVAL